MMRLILLDALDLLEDTFFMLSRPSMGRMQGYWGYTELRTAYRAFERWEAMEYLVAQQHGEHIRYKLAAKGKELLEQRRPSPETRKRRWDGCWRMVVFDFPEVARKARDAFRRELRIQRMGCLQKSVWITPDPVIPSWKQLLRELELTEWVLLFESAELGPVDDLEIAKRVWALDKLAADYQRYLADFGPLAKRLAASRVSQIDGELGQLVRRESEAYFEILSRDPLLPEALLPARFAGITADGLHREIRSRLRVCLIEGRP
jgi:phenylacetic acid degradation operon negative regulatory protein